MEGRFFIIFHLFISSFLSIKHGKNEYRVRIKRLSSQSMAYVIHLETNNFSFFLFWQVILLHIADIFFTLLVDEIIIKRSNYQFDTVRILRRDKEIFSLST